MKLLKHHRGVTFHTCGLAVFKLLVSKLLSDRQLVMTSLNASSCFVSLSLLNSRTKRAKKMSVRQNSWLPQKFAFSRMTNRCFITQIAGEKRRVPRVSVCYWTWSLLQRAFDNKFTLREGLPKWFNILCSLLTKWIPDFYLSSLLFDSFPVFPRTDLPSDADEQNVVDVFLVYF